MTLVWNGKRNISSVPNNKFDREKEKSVFKLLIFMYLSLSHAINSKNPHIQQIKSAAGLSQFGGSKQTNKQTKNSLRNDPYTSHKTSNSQWYKNYQENVMKLQSTLSWHGREVGEGNTEVKQPMQQKVTTYIKYR